MRRVAVGCVPTLPQLSFHVFLGQCFRYDKRKRDSFVPIPRYVLSADVRAAAYYGRRVPAFCLVAQLRFWDRNLAPASDMVRSNDGLMVIVSE
jgi:hypothetical protein